MHYLIPTPHSPPLVVDNPVRNEYRRRRRFELSARLGVTELPDPGANPVSDVDLATALGGGACARFITRYFLTPLRQRLSVDDTSPATRASTKHAI